MESVKITFTVACDDPRFAEIARILQRPPEEGKKAAPMSIRTKSHVPPKIALLLEYEKRSGWATWSQAMSMNAKVYKDPRGAGGMYTPASGYFEREGSWPNVKGYRMTDKAKAELERWKKRQETHTA